MKKYRQAFEKKALKSKLAESAHQTLAKIFHKKPTYVFYENEKTIYKSIQKKIKITKKQINSENNNKKFQAIIADLNNQINDLKFKIAALEARIHQDKIPNSLENAIESLKKKQKIFEIALKIKLTRKMAENTFKNSNNPNLYLFFHHLYISLEAMMISLKAVAGGLIDTNASGKLSDFATISNFLKFLVGSIPLIGSSMQNALEFSGDVMKYVDLKWHNKAIKNISTNIGGSYEFKPEILNLAIQLTERYQYQIMKLKSDKEVNGLSNYINTQILSSLLDGELDFKANLTEQWLKQLAQHPSKLQKISRYFHHVFKNNIKNSANQNWRIDELLWRPDILLTDGSQYGNKSNQLNPYGVRYGIRSEIDEFGLVYQGKNEKLVSTKIETNSTYLNVDSFQQQKISDQLAYEKLNNKYKKLKEVNTWLIKQNKAFEKRLIALENANPKSTIEAKKENEYVFFNEKSGFKKSI